MSLPSLKQLQYLVALYEHRHFGRAAEACNVTQSTLSAGLKELEATLRLQLVERTRRIVVFAPIGVRVVHQAQDLLLRAQNLSLVSRSGIGPRIRKECRDHGRIYRGSVRPDYCLSYCHPSQGYQSV